MRFAATKLIEGDTDIDERLELDQNEKELIEHSVQEMEAECGMDRNAALADMRYNFIEEVCAGTVVKCRESRERQRSEAIDPGSSPANTWPCPSSSASCWRSST